MLKEVPQERLRTYLLTFYSAAATVDWVQLMNKWLAEQATGDYSARMQALYAAAAV